MTRRRLARAAVALLLGVAALYVAVKGGRRALVAVATWKASRMNRQAWEATYTERGLRPPGGPRDGYWGARLVPHRHDARLGWILPELRYVGELEVARDGMQRVPAPAAGAPSLLILGASTAFGAYASDIPHTYFSRLAGALAASGAPVGVTVFATGAWKSQQELAALRVALDSARTRPDVVLFLDGLNDLTNGSNARALFGTETPTRDGSRWTIFYHEHDYAERVRLYLENMRAAAELARGRGAEVVLALQPALFEKGRQSARERELEAASLPPLGPRDTLRVYYDRMRAGLAAVAAETGAHFVDASRAFPDGATTFTDLWHFSDPGHAQLAARLAEALLPVVRDARAHRLAAGR